MVGWAPNSAGSFQMGISLTCFCFSISARRGRDGWLVVRGLNSATLEYHKICHQNDGTVDEGMVDGPRWQFHDQNL